MGCLNGKKTQILIAHQKERIDQTKKVPLAAKKSLARDKRILHTFLLLTTPMGRLDGKKLKFLLLIRRKE